MSKAKYAFLVVFTVAGFLVSALISGPGSVLAVRKIQKDPFAGIETQKPLPRSAVSRATGNIIVTLAGNGTTDDAVDGVAAPQSPVASPFGVAVDAAGNIYICDAGHHLIRKVDVATGLISTVAGTGNADFSGDGGPATAAAISDPDGIAIDSNGNFTFVDRDNHRIRKVDVGTGIITTVAGNGEQDFGGDDAPAVDASFDRPVALTFDASDNLYISDTGNNRIRRVDAASGMITTVVGTGDDSFSGDGGPANEATIDSPIGIDLDASGNIFFSDTNNNRVRRVDGATGIITTIAGNGDNGIAGNGGPAVDSELGFPDGLALDSNGNIFFSDFDNARIARIDGATGIITTYAGGGNFIDDGIPATAAQFGSLSQVAVDGSDRVIFGDVSLNKVFRVQVGTITNAADEDDDGFPTPIENALGSSPTDVNSTPFNAGPAVQDFLVADKITVKFNTRKTGSDIIKLKGTKAIGVFDLANQRVAFDIGGVVRAFTLDEKGRFKDDTAKLKMKIKDELKFTLTLKGDFQQLLADNGFEINTIERKEVVLPVIMVLNNTVFTGLERILFGRNRGKISKGLKGSGGEKNGGLSFR